MADIVFNVAKGAVAEKVGDGATNLGILLLQTAEPDAALLDHATVAAILAAANTEADFTNYGRKTGLTGTVTVDNANDRVDVALSSNPVTWTDAGGVTDNTLAKLIVFYDDGGTDATRIPLVALDCVISTDGNDLIVTFNSAGFYRAA